MTSESERSQTPLLPHHREMLEASAISSSVIEARGYRSVTDRQVLRDLGFTAAQSRVPGLLIPLRGMDGEPGGFQFRPDSPRENQGKPVKYESPKGQRNILDVPPTIRSELRHGRQAILVTEGAKKPMRWHPWASLLSAYWASMVGAARTRATVIPHSRIGKMCQ